MCSISKKGEPGDPTALYFAYGSNMSSARMRSRLSRVNVFGIGFVEGVRLVFDKRGADGSGKANLAPEAGSLVWGVLWSFPASDWRALDRLEPGYVRQAVEVTCEGASVRAEAYVATLLTNEPVPAANYVRLLLEGAREHGLPGEYVARIEALASSRRGG